MAEIYFTIAGTNHHHGQDFIEPKMEVKLVKNLITSMIQKQSKLRCLVSDILDM